MLTCDRCRKEVILFSIARGAPGADEACAQVRKDAREKGRLVLFNPPPAGPHRCPACEGPLEGSVRS